MGGIYRIWDKLTLRLKWIITNGHQAHFWLDAWVDGEGPLINKVLDASQISNAGITVDRLVDCAVQWHWDCSSHLLPEKTVLKIAATLPPRLGSDNDMVIWQGTSNGNFSTKSAYALLEEGKWKKDDPMW